MADLVVVGASLAGLRAVEAVRGDGWTGTIALVGDEEHLPYDRPPLSKECLSKDEWTDTTFREEAKLRDELDVELVLGTPATAIDTENRTITVGDRTISYGALVVATGAHARRLPGTEDLEGVHTIRNLDDALALREELRTDEAGRKVTVIGAGFIGSEVAAVATKLGHEVTIVEAAETPLAHAIGARMGAALTSLHERHGTTVLTGVSVEEVVGEGRVEKVRLADGTELDTDVLVVGIGAYPTTSWLEGSDLTLDNGVVADEFLYAGHGVWAAGDIVRWPNALFSDVAQGPMRIEHWTSAAEQGARAARNAVDPDSAKAYETVPYFWSDWYDSRVQFVGIAAAKDDVEIEVVMGDDAEGEPFTALYRSNDRIIGCLALDMRAEVMKFRRLIGKKASWDEALELAEQRRQKKAEKDAEKESPEGSASSPSQEQPETAQA
jgi:NADPH-dependent 2,4-dienoyl-CoA reductase/sulfur reductase-like enzyme